MMESSGYGTNIAIPDSDYEYEYDENETETFYIDIDMTSTNDPRDQLKQSIFKRRDARNGVGAPSQKASASGNTTRAESEEPDTGHDPETMDVDDNEPAPTQASQPRINAASSPKHNVSSTADPKHRQNDIQIMSFDTLNPVILYRGHYYTCTWSDMIGTNLFFAEPLDAAHIEISSSTSARSPPLLRGQGFDLQATSRIKLIARKARLVNLPGRRRKRRRVYNEEDGGEIVDLYVLHDNESNIQIENSSREAGIGGNKDDTAGSFSRARNNYGTALETPRSNRASTNRDVRKQANFLERLMDIKRKKGESDNVRTAFERTIPQTRRGSTASRADTDAEASIAPGIAARGVSTAAATTSPSNKRKKQKMTKEEYAKEIDKLNRKVVRGDREALSRLEEIYDEMEAVDDEDVGAEQGQFAGPSGNLSSGVATTAPISVASDVDDDDDEDADEVINDSEDEEDEEDGEDGEDGEDDVDDGDEEEVGELEDIEEVESK